MLDVLFDTPFTSDQSKFFHSTLACAVWPCESSLSSRFLPRVAWSVPSVPRRSGLVRLDRGGTRLPCVVEFGVLPHSERGPTTCLFLFCLVIPFRRFGALIPVVTSFTVAHSITLIASAYNFRSGLLMVPAASSKR